MMDFTIRIFAGLLAASTAAAPADGQAQAPEAASMPTTSAPTEVAPEALDAAPTEASSARVTPTTCTYRSYNWSTVERRAVNRRTVEKDYADVVDDERSPQDPRCTVCSEDQVTIDPAALGIDAEPIQVCWAFADEITQALRDIAESGEFEFTELTGYRPGRTRGRVVDGLRTEWSNHSFGTAIDINADHNGLYRSCNVDEVTAANIGRCDLGVGGAWNPTRYPNRTITAASIVYERFTTLVNWRWGGEIDGSTRDMMHFSPDGY